MNRAGYLFIPKLISIAKEKSLTYKQIIHVTKNEILTKLPPLKIINERMKQYSLVMRYGEISILSGKEHKKLEEQFKMDYENISKIKGIVASKGRVRGRAKIIFSRADFSKVKLGDILVTSMTTVNMMEAMKRAAAFVTDEGGITCHAAIISREMKKPCVISTKIATKVLHDGDEVEVDADRGIIRKLK